MLHECLIWTQREVNLNSIGNDPSDENERISPPQLAASEGHVHIVKALLEDHRMDLEFHVSVLPSKFTSYHTGSSDFKKIATSCLFLATWDIHAALFDTLPDVPGLQPNTHDPLDSTPLINAVFSESLGTVRSFFSRPSLETDVNIQGSATSHDFQRRKQRTPVLLASALEFPHIAKLLLGIPEINVDHYNHRNETALYYAAADGPSDTVRSLLEHGAHPNPKDAENTTPLWHATRRGNIAIVKMLLEAGADPHHACKRGSHPLGVAEAFDHTEVNQAFFEDPRVDLASRKPASEEWHQTGRNFKTFARSKYPEFPFHT